MTAFCAHPGCIHGLHAKNLSGVCKAHMHGPACRCAWCRAPRKVKAGRARRVVARYRVKTRAKLVAEGLLPGLDAAPALPPPTLKGTR